MVQLRGFRYLREPDDYRPASSTITPNPTPSSSPDSRSTSATSSVVSVGVAGLSSGGNLTAESSNSMSSSSQAFQIGPKISRQSKTNIDQRQTTTTTSTGEPSNSSQELQEARLDLGSDSEPEGSRRNSDAKTGEGDDDETGSGQLEAEEALDKVPSDVGGGPISMRFRSGSASAMAAASVTPLASRKYLLQQLSLQQQQQQQQPDNVSQWSLGGQQRREAGAESHFEIRWQSIRLLRRRQSVLPRAVAESAIYRRLCGGGPGWEEEQQREADLRDGISVCYSPPVAHRLVVPKKLVSSGGASMSSKEPPCEKWEMTPVGLPVSPASPDASRSVVLDGVSGSVFSGQLTAILGPSGVGKTTLLNSLTGRNQLTGSGRVSLVGATNRKRMSVVTVPQSDVLPGKLTVWEDLIFTSRLKHPNVGINHEQNVERIVRHLHLSGFKHNRIDKLSGGEARRLSIGRELLSSPDIVILDEPTSGLDANTCKKIIMALRDITEHSDHILDRPMSIIVTIHQPQKEVLDLFHRLYVMAVGGKVIYEGPPTGLLPVLVEQSSLGRLTAGEQLNDNPAIVALEVASGEYGSAVIGELASYHELATGYDFGRPMEGSSVPHLAGAHQGWSPFQTPKTPRTPRAVGLRHSSSLGARLSSLAGADLGSIGRPTPNLGYRRKFSGQLTDPVAQSVASLSYASTWDPELPVEVCPDLKVDKRLRRSVVMHGDFFSHTWTLMRRCWLLTTRDMFLMSIRIIGFVLVAGGMVQIFGHALDPNEHQCPSFETEITDVISFMGDSKERLLSIGNVIKQQRSSHLFFFQLILSLMMVTSAITGLVFPFQMRMFLREHKNGWYSGGPFVMSQTLAELPIDMIGPVICILISYNLCQQPESMYHWREMGYVVFTILGSLVCKSQAQLISAFLMDSVENSVFMSCVFVVFPALLSGVAVKVKNMIPVLQIASYGSFLRYVFDSLFILRYGYGMCPCNPELVDGYPARPSVQAIPPQLDNIARGYVDLGNQPALAYNQTGFNYSAIANSPSSSDPMDGNLFVRFLRLVTDAKNLFIADQTDLGDCTSYQSLYLVEIGVHDDHLLQWFGILLLFFIVSRFVIYFIVRLITKLRR